MSGFVIVQHRVKVAEAGNRPSPLGILAVYAFQVNGRDGDEALFRFLFATKYGCLLIRRKKRCMIAVYLDILRGDRSGTSHSVIIPVSNTQIKRRILKHTCKSQPSELKIPTQLTFFFHAWFHVRLVREFWVEHELWHVETMLD